MSTETDAVICERLEASMGMFAVKHGHDGWYAEIKPIHDGFFQSGWGETPEAAIRTLAERLTEAT